MKIIFSEGRCNVASDVRVWIKEKRELIGGQSDRQFLARAVGSVERPTKVIVYEVKNGYVESKLEFKDWNCVENYQHCFVDCQTVGEFEIGQLVGYFPIMYQ
jgi:hypothetical protein